MTIIAASDLPCAERLGIATQMTVHVTVHVTVIDGGTAAAALVQAARRLGVDGIALASHGRSGPEPRHRRVDRRGGAAPGPDPVLVVRSGAER
jgi:hypothetical protein